MKILSGEIAPLYWDLKKLSEMKSIDRISQEFEAYLLNTFLREALKPSEFSLFGKGFQASMYRDFLSMTLSEEIAQKGNLGLGSFIERAVENYKKNSL